MRKVLIAAIALSCIGAGSSFAAATKGSYALGFVNSEAPIGGRYMISEKMGIDAGIGFGDVEDVGSAFALDFGLPINMHSGENAQLQIRPGLTFSSSSSDVSSDLDDDSVTITGLIEFQVWLTNSLSVNAGHGLSIETDPTVIEFFAADVFKLGFHYWVK